MSDQLSDFINHQHERDLKITESLARISQAQEDMTTRLFGGPNQVGALDRIVAATKQNEADCTGCRVTVNTRLVALESWRGTSKAWIAGAVAVLGLEGTMLGMWVSHLPKVVK